MGLKITVDHQKCTGCGECASVCPVRAVEIRNMKAYMDTDRCILCTSCIDVCEVDAIRIPAAKGEFIRARKIQ